jgi:hypothetical protein
VIMPTHQTPKIREPTQNSVLHNYQRGIIW